MDSSDGVEKRGQAKPPRAGGSPVCLQEQIRPAQLGSQPRIAKAQGETDLSQREIGAIPRCFIRHRCERTRLAQAA